MQFVSMSAYFLDIARLCGRGRWWAARLANAIAPRLPPRSRLTSVWAVVVAVLVSPDVFAGRPLVDRCPQRRFRHPRAAARIYLPWAALAPLAGVWAFWLDGNLHRRHPRRRDAQRARPLLVFLVAWWLLPSMGQPWPGRRCMNPARTLTLGCYYPALARSG